MDNFLNQVGFRNGMTSCRSPTCGSYLKVIREKCCEVPHIFDRFHIVAKMNKALDEVRAGESHWLLL